MTTTRTRGRTRLDARLSRLHGIGEQPRPHRGWVRAIRDALGMSARELADRMGVQQASVAQLERSERLGTIKLETLERAARALDCELVYFLRPRASLEEMVMDQARRKAAEHLMHISHHSRLEDQAVGDEATTAQLEELAKQLADRRGLWSTKRG